MKGFFASADRIYLNSLKLKSVQLKKLYFEFAIIYLEVTFCHFFIVNNDILLPTKDHS